MPLVGFVRFDFRTFGYCLGESRPSRNKQCVVAFNGERVLFGEMARHSGLVLLLGQDMNRAGRTSLQQGLNADHTVFASHLLKIFPSFFDVVFFASFPKSEQSNLPSAAQGHL